MLIIIFIRSLLFTIAFYINFLLLLCCVFFVLIFKGEKKMIWVARKWNIINILLLKYICGVNYKVKITEGFDENEAYLMLMKHESTWETYFLFEYFKKTPVPIAKKELKYIPIFGTMLLRVGTILVDRNAGINSIKELIKKSKYYLLEKKRPMLIAPQGTRVPIGGTAKEYPYKSGFIGVLEVCDVTILPIVLDSGKCWPKGSFLKYPGTINVSILEPISREKIKSLNKKEVLALVENTIEQEREKMI